MGMYREKAPGLWDDAPWKEIGLPAEPVVVFEEITEAEPAPEITPPKALESSTKTRSSAWD